MILTFPGKAAADDSSRTLLLAGLILGVGGVVANTGAQVSLIRDRPTREWGGLATGIGALNLLVGGGLLVYSIGQPKSEVRSALRIAGGVYLSIAAVGLISGAITLAAAKSQGGTGSASAGLMPSGLVLGGSF